MSALTDAHDPPAGMADGDRLARRNALVLAVAQALAGGNNTVLVATAGIVGAMLAPDRGLATVPISVMVLGMWMGTLPMGILARRFGRRSAFQIATLCGVTWPTGCRKARSGTGHPAAWGPLQFRTDQLSIRESHVRLAKAYAVQIPENA